MITSERLRELLIYNEETGIFSWRRSVRGNRGQVGCYDRYIRIRIDGKLYYAHRLAWLYAYGVFPDIIDHIDGDPTNNRLSNLRSTTPKLNQFNRKVPPAGTYLHQGKWRVQVSRRHIGLFDTRKEALAARQKAVEEILR